MSVIATAEQMADNRPPELQIEERFCYDSTLSDEELISRYHAAQNEAARLHCMQMAKKILLK